VTNRSKALFDRSGGSLRRTVNAVALVIAVAISISTPLGYGLVAYNYENVIAQFRVNLFSRRIANYVYLHPELWQYQTSRLQQFLLLDVARGPSHSRILNSDGKLVFAEKALPMRFPLTRQTPIVVGETTIGFVENTASLDRLAREIGGVALLSLLLGICTYLAVRVFPLRVLDRTLRDLQQTGEALRDSNMALELQNRELREREQSLKATKETLNLRSDQLLEAQRLGKIGDWSYRLGQSYIVWADELYDLLGYDPNLFGSSYAAVMAAYVGDGAQRVLASHAEIMRTGGTRSVDVKFKRGDGSIGDFAVISKAMTNEDDRVIGFRGTIQDISERKRAEEQLEKLAYYDPLTGLANRALFHREVEDVLLRCGRSGNIAALLLLDLDRFKEVNDSLGHAAGDELLTKVAHLISRALGGDHFLCRLGGDEFAIITAETDRASVEALATAVLVAVSGPILLERGEVLIGTSVGVAIMPHDGVNLNDLLRNADLALYRAKEDGRGRFHFFEAGMSAAVQHKMALSTDLRRAISENSGLSVHYQPQVELATGRVTGFEALMRWTHPTRGNVPPGEFIPIAESSHLICDLGLWILREAARQAKAWLDEGEPPRQVAVNVSAAQIWHTDFVSDVVEVLEETGLRPDLLCLELTESLLADHAEGRVRNVLTELNRIGVTLALDDFGTDYSSLGYLTQLPFDKLKIDRIFVDGIATSDRARRLLQGVIALGRGLGMTIVMEGVEKSDEIAILRGFNCDIIQGYVFARPTPAAEALGFAQQLEIRPALAPCPDRPAAVA
jgi:diguanylate cyclase (GGDEF)-like protein/PAS domain S-box-containing protein